MRLPPIPEATRAFLFKGDAVQRLTSYLMLKAVQVADRSRLGTVMTKEKAGTYRPPRSSSVTVLETTPPEPAYHTPKPRLKARPTVIDTSTQPGTQGVRTVDTSNEAELRAVLARGWRRL